MRPASPIRPDIVTCDAHTVPNNAHTLLNSAQTVLNSAHTVLSSALYWTVLNSAHTVLNSAHCSEQCTHYWTVHSVLPCTHYHSVLSLYCSAHSVLNSAHSTEQCLLYWTMHTVLNRAHTVLDSANTVLNSAIFTAVHTYAQHVPTFHSLLISTHLSTLPLPTAPHSEAILAPGDRCLKWGHTIIPLKLLENQGKLKFVTQRGGTGSRRVILCRLAQKDIQGKWLEENGMIITSRSGSSSSRSGSSSSRSGSSRSE